MEPCFKTRAGFRHFLFWGLKWTERMGEVNMRSCDFFSLLTMTFNTREWLIASVCGGFFTNPEAEKSWLENICMCPSLRLARREEIP